MVAGEELELLLEQRALMLGEVVNGGRVRQSSRRRWQDLLQDVELLGQRGGGGVRAGVELPQVVHQPAALRLSLALPRAEEGGDVLTVDGHVAEGCRVAQGGVLSHGGSGRVGRGRLVGRGHRRVGCRRVVWRG